VKAKSLNGLEVPSLRTGLVGDFVRKNAAYDLWALEPPASVDGARGGKGGEIIGGRTAEAEAGGGALVGVGAEELHNLSVLLPCKRKGGKLFLGACGDTHPIPIYLFPPKEQMRASGGVFAGLTSIGWEGKINKKRSELEPFRPHITSHASLIGFIMILLFFFFHAMCDCSSKAHHATPRGRLTPPKALETGSDSLVGFCPRVRKS
jgi:hypothetical protein